MIRAARIAAAVAVLALAGILGWRVTHQDNGSADAILHDRVVRAPAFMLPRLTGSGKLSLASFHGKAVVLNFWASDCIPCKKEMPQLEAAAQRWAPRGVAVVGIDPGFDSPAAARGFMHRHGITYPSVFDHYADVSTRYGVQFTPTTFFIDRRGLIVKRILGPMKDAVLDAQIRRIAS